jgi:hypothetical protein
MVVADHLVGLQVPAFDHLHGCQHRHVSSRDKKTRFVLATTEQIRMARRHAQASDRANVTRQAQLELSTRQVPDLDYSVPSAGCKPLVTRLDGYGADPTKMTGDDPLECPLGVKLWFDSPGCLVPGEGFRQRAGRGEGGLLRGGGRGNEGKGRIG